MTTFDTLNKRFDKLKSERSRWDNHYQEIRDLVNPDAIDFTRTTQPGDRRTEQILDGTAPWACEQLASGLQSFNTSPSDRWFGLCIEDYDYKNDAAALLWLEAVADLMYSAYNDPRSNTNDSMHEAYLDLGSFGTTVIYQEWDYKDLHIVMRAYALADCFVAENSKGQVDTVFRRTSFSTRQIEQEWPNHTCKKIKEEKNPDKMWQVIHCVYPRTDRDFKKLNKTNKEYASTWICIEAKEVLDESGYDAFPYHCARWTKRSGETYGRSPGMTCLPDIKMINAMERVGLRALQKIVDPPILTPNDGFALPINTTPGGLIYYDASVATVESMKPLETRGRVEIGEEKMEQKRQHILRCFYADWIARFKKKERQTAVEIMDDRDEMMQLMAPILGRLQTELLGPMLSLTYFLLNRAGKIPPAPTSLQGRKIEPIYISPAAKAQAATKVLNIRRFLQELIPLANIDPTVLDIVDYDKLARELANGQDVSRKILRTVEEVAQKRAERQQSEQMNQAAQIAEPISGAIKNLADAKEKGYNVGV